MKTVLMTGIGGFIGNNIAEYLISKQYNVIGIYKNRKPNNPKIPLIHMDLSKTIKELPNCDAIIHLAAQIQPASIEEYLDNTIQPMRNICNWAQKMLVKQFIYVSSTSIYGETIGEVNINSDRINLDDYGLTKYIGERILENTNIKNRWILRLPRVLGKGTDMSSPWLPLLIKRLIQNEEVIYYNPNLIYNNLVYIDDISEFMEKILRRKNEELKRIVLGGKQEATIIEILKLLKDELNSSSILTEKKVNKRNTCYAIDVTEAQKNGFYCRDTTEIIKRFIKDIIIN